MKNKKTHCKNGHEFSAENTYLNPRGTRICRVCTKHHALAYYYRQNGRILPGDYEPRTTVKNFEDAFIAEPNSGCWIWLRSLSPKGYGRLSYNGACVGAHRVSWILYRGPIPSGMHILHRCDMPACVNPDHLFIGTNADNVADCKNKGRLALHDGENNGNAKLSNKIVDIIRNSTARADDLALQLGVHWSTVYRIRSKSIWKEKSECPSQ